MKTIERSALLALTALLCLCQFSYGQQTKDYDLYSASAKEQSMLFRGRQAISYTNIRYNGTYFWDTPEFKKGDVLYNGKLYTGVLMNIDAALHQLLVRYAPGMPEVVVSKDYVEYFIIDGEKYINAGFMGWTDDEESYLKVLSEDNHVYYRVHKVFSKSTNNVNGTMIGYYDSNYNEDLTNFFRCRQNYYTVVNGKLKSLSRRKALKLAAYAK